MKKAVLLLLLSHLFISFCNSQISKNSWILGGEFRLTSQKEELNNQKFVAYSITPAFGYFIADRIAVGLQSDFTKNVITEIPIIRVAQNTNSIGPFARMYFLNETQKANVFGELGYRYTWARDENYGTVYKSNGYTVKAGPSFFVSKNISLEFALGFFHSKDTRNHYKLNQFQTGLGFKVHF